MLDFYFREDLRRPLPQECVPVPPEKHVVRSDVEFEVEASVISLLPELPGLLENLTESQRFQLFSVEIDRARENFISLYGDPFGAQSKKSPGYQLSSADRASILDSVKNFS